MTEHDKRMIHSATSLPWDSLENVKLAWEEVKKADPDNPVAEELEREIYKMVIFFERKLRHDPQPPVKPAKCEVLQGMSKHGDCQVCGFPNPVGGIGLVKTDKRDNSEDEGYALLWECTPCRHSFGAKHPDRDIRVGLVGSIKHRNYLANVLRRDVYDQSAGKP